MRLLDLLRKPKADPAETYKEEIAAIARSPFTHIPDDVGRKLEKAGLCRREWVEGMGAGFYLYYPPDAPGK